MEMVIMDPYELLHPHGSKPTGVFACSKCNTVGTEEKATKCCAPCACGRPIPETEKHWARECPECRAKRWHEQFMAKFDEAEEIEWDGKIPLFAGDLFGLNDWYGDMDDLLEAIEFCESEDEDYERPEFVFASKYKRSGVDLVGALDCMLDGAHDDAEFPPTEAVAELQKHVDAFNKDHAIEYYDVDFTKKIRIQYKNKDE